MKEITNRVFGYDLLKALAMLMVVFYHVEMLDFCFDSNSYFLPNINKCFQVLCAAGVPLFFMVNGVFTVRKTTTINKLMIRIGRLFFIAVIWTVFLRLFIGGVVLEKGVSLSIRDFYSKYWFFYSLIYTYIINYIIDIAPKWCGHVVLVFLFIVTFVNNFAWDLLLWLNPNQTLPSWGHMGFFTLYGVVYSRIGAYLKNKHYCVPICVVVMVVGYALIIFETIIMSNAEGKLFDGVNAAFPTLGAMLLSCGIFCLLKDLKAQNNTMSRLITLVGINSGGVYVLHYTFIVLVRDKYFMDVMGVQYLSIAANFIIALFVTLLSAYISSLISRSPVKILLKF
ncbi:MAG: acyltransferase family protein [Muribaculaceae bacterium]|nr:acyltransferase family protein [Muribaculaceae bacterium]